MGTEGKSRKSTPFKALLLPAGQYAFVPTNLDILIPRASRIPAHEKHHLAYLPWKNTYLKYIPKEYQDFFNFVLPFLHARSSNVHTALSVAQLPYLIKNSKHAVNERLIYLSLILHDCGWSQVNQQDLVKSFNYNGVSPVGSDSLKPKQKHLIYGEALAYKLLDSFDFDDAGLTDHDIYTVSEIIRRHDHDAAWEQGKYGQIGTEIKIMCDSDRLWSYTHENFWLDTIRKGVPADAYLKLIYAEIPKYFFTPQGRTRAKQLAKERRAEVAAYQEILQDAEKRTLLLQNAHHPSKRAIYRLRQLVLSSKSRRIQRSHIRQNAY